MFYFKINRIKICDNRENPKYLIFGPDVAQLKLMSFIATDKTQLPDITEFLKTNDKAQKSLLLKQAVEMVVSARIFTEIDHIKDNHILSFGETGYVLYKSENIPDDFDWQFIAYESDDSIRYNAQFMQAVINDNTFTDFTENLAILLQTALNPAYTASVLIAKYAINTICNINKRNNDDLIGILYTSLNRRQHYPHGERKRDRVPDLTNNMLIDYSLFGYDEK